MADQAYHIPEEDIRDKAKADGITHLSTGIAVARNGKILVVRRSADDYLGGSYELPGGGVDAGETLAVSVERELLEETGLVVSKIVGMFPGFEYTTPAKPRVRQFNFLVEATGEVRLSQEHDAYLWINASNFDTVEITGPMRTCLQDALALVTR